MRLLLRPVPSPVLQHVHDGEAQSKLVQTDAGYDFGNDLGEFGSENGLRGFGKTENGNGAEEPLRLIIGLHVRTGMAENR